MKSVRMLLTLTLGALAMVLPIMPGAQAATRTWVASTGADTGTCPRSAPCATFSYAVSQTDAFGEVNCADAGSFGFLNVTKSITISCEAGTAGILVASVGDGIFISTAATDVVYLRGLDINGAGDANKPYIGIQIEGGGKVHIEKCVVHGITGSSGTGTGILYNPSAASSLFISDTVIADNGSSAAGGGILLQPDTTATVNVSVERLRLTNNGYGLDADGSNTGALQVSVRDSLASGNANSGFIAESTSGRMKMMIQNSEASSNGTNGIKADGSNTLLTVGGSAIFGNASAITIKNNATLLSYQNNQIDGNTANDTPVPSQNLH